MGVEHHSHGGDCRELLDSLSAYLDRELTPDACREIEAHLADCPPCIEFVRSLRGTIALCRQYQTDEAPRQLPEDLKGELKALYAKALTSRHP